MGRGIARNIESPTFPLKARQFAYDVAGDNTRPFPAPDPPRGHVQATQMAAGEMGGLSLALRWLQRFIDERLPPLTEVSLAASTLAELRHGHRNTGVEALKRLLRQG